MLDDEEADEKSGRRNRQQQGQPVAVMRCPRHDHQQRDERRRRGDELKNASLNVGAICGESPGQHRSELKGWVAEVSPTRTHVGDKMVVGSRPWRAPEGGLRRKARYWVGG